MDKPIFIKISVNFKQTIQSHQTQMNKKTNNNSIVSTQL